MRTGMVLAEDVRDAGGQLLVPAGHTLTEKHLRIFQMVGIQEAVVEGEGEDQAAPEATLDPAKLAAAEDKLRPLFRHTDLGNPVVDALFRYCCEAEALRS